MQALKTVNCILSLTLLLLPIVAQSCQLHGGRGFDAFSSFHPMEQMHYQQTFTQPLHVTHPSSINADKNAPAVVNIKYGMPDTYQNVVIRFSGSENVIFPEGAELTAQGVAGSYPLKYRVITAGSHQISAHINALHLDESVDFEQHITVNAT